MTPDITTPDITTRVDFRAPRPWLLLAKTTTQVDSETAEFGAIQPIHGRPGLILGRLILTFAVTIAIAEGTATQVVGSPVIRSGDSRVVTVVDGSEHHTWRLELVDHNQVWIALRTMDLIPDLAIERWDRAGAPVAADWERLGFNEFVCIRAGPGTYRLRVGLRSNSPRSGEFTLSVGQAPPPRLSGTPLAEWEIRYFRQVLSRPNTESMPPFEVAVIERLITALDLLDRVAPQQALLNRAIALYRQNGQFQDAARLLEARAGAESQLGRIRQAVGTYEEAASLRQVDGDDYHAALALGRAYRLGATRPGRLADRLRLRRAFALAQRTESPGHVMEDLADLFREKDLRLEAVEALLRAGAAHEACADLASAVRAVRALFSLQASCQAIETCAVRVEAVAAQCFKHGRIQSGADLLRGTADVALESGRPEIALRLLQSALEVLVGKEGATREEAMTRRRRAEILHTQGRTAEATADSVRAARQFARLGDAREEGTERIQLGFLRRSLRDYAGALRAFRRASELSMQFDDRELLVRAWNGQGCIHHDNGDLDAASQAYDRAFAAASKQSLDRRLSRDVVRNRILINQDRADAEAAQAAAVEGVAYLDRVEDAEGVALTWVELGNALKWLGHADKALDVYRKALELYRSRGDHRGVGRSLNEMGNTNAKAGRHTAALEQYRAAHRLACESGDRELEVWTIFNLGYTHARLGDHARAADWFARAVEHYRPSAGGTPRFARFLRYVSTVFMDANRDTEGIAFVREAAETLTRCGTPLARARARLALGDLYHGVGRSTEADEAWMQAALAAKEAERPDLLTAALARLVTRRVDG